MEPIGEVRKHPLVADTWSRRHDLCVVLAAQGLTNNEIAAEMGYDAAYVSRILGDPRAAVRLQELRENLIVGIEDAGRKMVSLASEAVDVAAKWMRQDEDGQVAVRSAFGILDRAGYSAVVKQVNLNAAVPQDKIDQLIENTKRVSPRTHDYGKEIVLDSKPATNGAGST